MRTKVKCIAQEKNKLSIQEHSFNVLVAMQATFTIKFFFCFAK